VIKKTKLSELISFKANFLEIIVTTLILALGINILSSGITDYFELSSEACLAWGSILIFTGGVFLSRNIMTLNSGTMTFKATITQDRETRELTLINGYKFSEEISKYFKSLFAENLAISRLWKSNKITCQPKANLSENNANIPKANLLVIEGVEYYLLHSLSIHLNDYFRKKHSANDDSLITLKRNHIPSVLLENRFFECFTKPMEQREVFSPMDGKPQTGEIIAAFGKNGVFFERFDMTLPKGSSVIREADSSISIKTGRFTLNALPVFEGFAANLPSNFEKLYLGKNFLSVSSYGVRLVINIKFSLTALMTSKGWDYYWWLDSFLDKLEQEFSSEHFYQKISWNQNSALIHMLDIKSKKLSNPDKDNSPEANKTS